MRVAAYCRVSTAQDDQLHSLAHQQQYFAEYISRRPDWELAEVYADRGLSGTSVRRPAFQRMIAAAQAGKIDLILTKEVSRFARNTVDALAHTRALRKIGVGVVFIGDNIDTRQNDGEFRLTIMASVAQEESRKTSERVKWGQRRSMEQGVVFGCNQIYGFDLRGGQLTVKPDEAAVIRMVYHKFLHEGKGSWIIARELTEAGILPPRAKDKPWSSTMVLRLLRNEKYCGDLLQKKTCTPDFLDHKKVKNDGREEQIYLPDHHEAIVSRAVFDQAQRELQRRATKNGQYARHSARYWCSGKLICAACGSRLTPRRRQRTDRSTYQVWTCRTRVQRGSKGCAMHSVTEDTVCACMAHLLAELNIDAAKVVEDAAALTHRLTGAERAACRAVPADGTQPGSLIYGTLLERIVVSEDALTVYLCGVEGAFWMEISDWKRGVFSACTRL
nr:recombinase family protein [uncultured Agathobaculum sp.]